MLKDHCPCTCMAHPTFQTAFENIHCGSVEEQQLYDAAYDSHCGRYSSSDVQSASRPIPPGTSICLSFYRRYSIVQAASRPNPPDTSTYLSCIGDTALSSLHAGHTRLIHPTIQLSIQSTVPWGVLETSCQQHHSHFTIRDTNALTKGSSRSACHTQTNRQLLPQLGQQ